MFYEWRPYVSVAERRRQAAREMEKRRKKGHAISPVLIEGRVIAKTFWGKSWCENLEGYSDYASRLPRGRTYVRNGSVVDLQIAPREVKALVSGSTLYEVAVKVAPVPKARWSAICKDSAGAIDSLVELLQGRFSTGVMERLCRQKTGLFPSPQEIELECSCPDWASMCKHVAAVLYGIGARLDDKPELLFRLREVDEQQLLAGAGDGLALVRGGSKKGAGKGRVIEEGDLAELFGLEMAVGSPPAIETRTATRTAGKARKPVKVGGGKVRSAPARDAPAKKAGPSAGGARPGKPR